MGTCSSYVGTILMGVTQKENIVLNRRSGHVEEPEMKCGNVLTFFTRKVPPSELRERETLLVVDNGAVSSLQRPEEKTTS